MKLYEKHEALRDKFEVLAFHDPRAKTFEELDEKLERIIEKRWDGKTLPFPILLDATGKTVKAFGIRGYPTNVLIDPEGRVVKGHAPRSILEKKLEELAPPEPEPKAEGRTRSRSAPSPSQGSPRTTKAAPKKQDEGDGKSPSPRQNRVHWFEPNRST